MANWTNQTKNTTSFSTQTKSVTSFSNISKTLNGQVTASAGLAMGPLGCTYSGGQILIAGSLSSWTNQTKS